MIIIADAGIGGSTTGWTLTHIRARFRIFERAAELQGVGTGIALSPNAYQAVAHIGMEKSVRRIGWDVASAELRDQNGRVMVRASMPKAPAGNPVDDAREAATGFVLQHSADLNPGTWTAAPETITDNGTTKSITANLAPGNRFFRLFKP